jgi:hypothetical protein
MRDGLGHQQWLASPLTAGFRQDLAGASMAQK